jgi:hypothetical protein
MKPDAPAVDPAARDKSRAAFKKGVAQIKAQDWQGARASFEEAYSLVQHPSILLNLGISRLKTDDPAGAEEALMKFLQEDSGAGPDELASARDALAEARSKIGTVHLALTPATAKVTIDGKPVTGTDVRMKAGSHQLTIEADGYQSADKTVDVPAKSTIDVAAVLASKGGGTDKPREKPQDQNSDANSWRPIAGYASAGVGGVALIATIYFGLKAIGLNDDYTNKNKPDTYRNADTKSSGIAARTGADVCLLLTLAGAAGAVIFLFTDIGASKAPPAKPAEVPKAGYVFPSTLTW